MRAPAYRRATGRVFVPPARPRARRARAADAAASLFSLPNAAEGFPCGNSHRAAFHKGVREMRRVYMLAGVLTLAVLVTGLHAQDKDKGEKPKDVKSFMKQAHAGDAAFKSVVTKAAKDKE